MTIVKVQRVITPEMYRQELRFLWLAHCLSMLYVSMKFHENVLNRFQVIDRTRNDHCQISKGNNSKNVWAGVTILVVYTLSDDALNFCEVSWKHLEQFSSYRADTTLQLSNFKEEYLKNVLTRVMVLVVCTSSDNALYFYEVSCK